MKIDRMEVLNKLESLVPGIATKAIIEQSSCFVFNGKQVVSFNDEVACFSDLDIGFQGAVPSVPLLSLFKQLKDKELDITAEDGVLLVKGKRKKAEIVMEQEILLAIEEIENPGEWSKLSKGFSKALELVSKCVSKNESQFILSCINVHKDHVEASDDFQAIRYSVSTKIKDPCLLRGTSAQLVAQFRPRKISVTENWIHFMDADGCRFSCRKYLDEFPDISVVLDVEGPKVKFPSGLQDAITNANIFSSGNVINNVVNVKLMPKKIRLQGEGAAGKYTEVFKSNYDGEETEFVIDPFLLLETSKLSEDCIVTEDRLKVDNDKFVYATCTVKE